MTKIVQCPACNTKFALNESQLAGIENPKFQCSRCQTIFNLDNTSNDTKSDSLKETSKDQGSQTILPENPSGSRWNLGTNPTADSNSVVNDSDNYLKDFSIDVNKFSLGIPSLSKPEEIKVGQQLDFGFNDPIINHPTQIEDPPAPEAASLKETPTQRISRISPELLDTLVYGESGSEEITTGLSWDEKPEQKLNESNDLMGIFRGGSQRSSSGIHETQTIISETEMIKPAEGTSPSWSQLKQQMEKQDEEDNLLPVVKTEQATTSETKLSDLASIDLMNIPFKDFNDPAASLNRSMKHTTVMKRDELEVEGFMKPLDHEEQEIDQDYPTSDRPAIKWNPKSIFKNLKRLTNIPKAIKFKKINLTPFSKSVLLAWSVPGFFLIAISIWSNSLKNKEQLENNLITNAFALFTPPEVLLPPVDLVLNTLSAELRPDKSGDPMIVVSGFLFNAGIQTILNPTIETRTFDKGNTMIKSMKAPIPNELSRFASNVNLTEITKEEILKLQNQRSWDGIAPNKSIPFKVVVTDIGAGYQYFSAKIYSVSEIS